MFRNLTIKVSLWLLVVLFTGLTCSIATTLQINDQNLENEYAISNTNENKVEPNGEKGARLILTLISTDELYVGKELFPIESLEGKLKRFVQENPYNNFVYFKANKNTSFEDVVKIFDKIRNAEIYRVKLSDNYDGALTNSVKQFSAKFQIMLPEPPDEGTGGGPGMGRNNDSTPKKAIDEGKPNPFTLVVNIGKDGALSLNREEAGNISDPKILETLLSNVFKERKKNKLFKKGTKKIETTVFLSVSKSNKYSDFIKLVQVVKTSGAEPIGVQVDALY